MPKEIIFQCFRYFCDAASSSAMTTIEYMLSWPSSESPTPLNVIDIKLRTVESLTGWGRVEDFEREGANI